MKGNQLDCEDKCFIHVAGSVVLMTKSEMLAIDYLHSPATLKNELSTILFSEAHLS